MEHEYVDHKVKKISKETYTNEQHLAITKEGEEVLHNIDGPAYKEWNNKGNLIHKEYCLHGNPHNPEGAALILCYPNGDLKCSKFFLHGIPYSVKEIILIATMLNVVRFEHSNGLTELCYNGFRYAVSDLDVDKLRHAVDIADIWSRITPHILKHLNN